MTMNGEKMSLSSATLNPTSRKIGWSGYKMFQECRKIRWSTVKMRTSTVKIMSSSLNDESVWFSLSEQVAWKKISGGEMKIDSAEMIGEGQMKRLMVEKERFDFEKKRIAFEKKRVEPDKMSARYQKENSASGI